MSQQIYKLNFVLISLLLSISFSMAISTSGLIANYEYENDYNDSHSIYDMGTSGSGQLFNSTFKKCDSYSLYTTTAGYVLNTSGSNFYAGDSSFSFGGWVSFSSLPASSKGYTFMGICNGLATGNGLGIWVDNEDGSPAIATTGYGAGYFITTAWIPTLNNFYHIYLTYLNTTSQVSIYIDGVKVVNGTINDLNFGTCTKIAVSNIPWGSSYLSNQHSDSIQFWNKALSASEITELYNSGSCLPYPFTSAEINDTTPPTISVIQYPSNITYLNVFNITQINATITDNIYLNTSTINLTITHNLTEIYINGTKQIVNRTISYNTNTGNIFQFILDEQDLISASHNLNPNLFENTTHKNFTLTGLNYWLKMEFLNISPYRRANFYEIMTENATALSSNSEYYYCNSGYTAGNPVSSIYCTQFYSSSNNDEYNHVHAGGKSQHKVYPLGINTTTGQINGINVTPISYILKRGTVTGDRVFYLENVSRVNAMQTSNNNGNNWNNYFLSPGIIGTVDSHIHQIGENESFSYTICAKDNSSNSACSIPSYDLIDFPIFPPNAVNIYSPIEDTIYNGTILINHSISFSSTGQTIVNYSYYYAEYNTTDYSFIYVNNHPITYYNWDISNILNGKYTLKLVIVDSLGYNTTQYQDFNVTNEESLTTQLLQDILTQLEEINNTSKETGVGVYMLWIIFFVILFYVAGWVTKIYPLWSISGIGFVIISLYYANSISSNYDKLLFYIFLFLGIFSFISGIAMYILTTMDKNKKRKNAFYEGY